MTFKEIRQKKGLTQQELSAQSGIKITTIQKLERGENNLSGAKFSTVLALYRVLGSDVFIAAGMTEEVEHAATFMHDMQSSSVLHEGQRNILLRKLHDG